MTERKKRRGLRFLTGFLLYLLMLALLLGAVLYVFRDFLAVYEATRPERALEQVRSDLAEHRFGEGCREAVSALGLTLQSEEEVMPFVSALLENARLVEDLTQSGEDRRSFRIVEAKWHPPRMQAYADLDAAGFDQVPCATNWYPDFLYAKKGIRANDVNFPLTVAHCRGAIDPRRLKGFMMTPWSRTVKRNREHILHAIDLVGQSMLI